jgi:hypothetical protein
VHAQIIRCDIKPGSVERSTDLETEGAFQQRTVLKPLSANQNSATVNKNFGYNLKRSVGFTSFTRGDFIIEKGLEIVA